MMRARWSLDAREHDLDSKARALEALARHAATSAAYAPSPGDDDPGWAEEADRLRLDRPRA